jgi:hypothetical protein
VQLAPNSAPEAPPHVLSQVPHVVEPQQSVSMAQFCPVDAHPHVLFTHWSLQQSLFTAHVAPVCAPEAPPHVPSHVPQLWPLQQSPELWHAPPTSVHGFAQTPLLHTSTPQQSLELAHVAPVPRQPHVPVPLHTLGAQQSLVLLQDAPEPEHPHVDVLVSQASEPQQSPLPVQPWPLAAQPQVPLTQSPEQQSDAVEHDAPSEVHAVGR